MSTTTTPENRAYLAHLMSEMLSLPNLPAELHAAISEYLNKHLTLVNLLKPENCKRLYPILAELIEMDGQNEAAIPAAADEASATEEACASDVSDEAPAAEETQASEAQAGEAEKVYEAFVNGEARDADESQETEMKSDADEAGEANEADDDEEADDADEADEAGDPYATVEQSKPEQVTAAEAY